MHCMGCGQNVHEQKANHPYYRKKMRQCPRCLTFERETAPVPVNFGGPLQHSLTYQKFQGHGLGVMEEYQRELPALNRAGWMVQSATPSGQVRLAGKVGPSQLIVTLIRAQMTPPMMAPGVLPPGFPETR